MKKNYLIAVDLDDTLVYEFDKYDKVSFELLKRLSKTIMLSLQQVDLIVHQNTIMICLT